jgi:hypothetical protein
VRAVRQREVQPILPGHLAHLDRETPVDRPGHLGDDSPSLLPFVHGAS